MHSHIVLSTGAKVHTLKKAPGGHFTNAEIEQVFRQTCIAKLSRIATPGKKLDTLKVSVF